MSGQNLTSGQAASITVPYVTVVMAPLDRMWRGSALNLRRPALLKPIGIQQVRVADRALRPR